MAAKSNWQLFYLNNIKRLIISRFSVKIKAFINCFHVLYGFTIGPISILCIS